MSDIEIARAAQKKPIFEIGDVLGIPSSELVPFGHDKAKISQTFINSVKNNADGKLILVTAINPTPAGEGKTTTTVGLGDGLNRIGKKVNIGTKTNGPPVPLSTDKHAVKKPTKNKLMFDGVDWLSRRLAFKLAICLYAAKIRTIAINSFRVSALTLASVCVPTNAPGIAPIVK